MSITPCCLSARPCPAGGRIWHCHRHGYSGVDSDRRPVCRSCGYADHFEGFRAVNGQILHRCPELGMKVEAL